MFIYLLRLYPECDTVFYQACNLSQYRCTVHLPLKLSPEGINLAFATLSLLFFHPCLSTQPRENTKSLENYPDSLARSSSHFFLLIIGRGYSFVYRRKISVYRQLINRVRDWTDLIALIRAPWQIFIRLRNKVLYLTSSVFLLSMRPISIYFYLFR